MYMGVFTRKMKIQRSRAECLYTELDKVVNSENVTRQKDLVWGS